MRTKASHFAIARKTNGVLGEIFQQGLTLDDAQRLVLRAGRLVAGSAGVRDDDRLANRGFAIIPSR